MDTATRTLPVPLLVHAPTGQPAPALPAEGLPHLSGDLPGAEQRSIDSTHLGTDSSVGDPDDLTQTGWCILFASDADPAIKTQLQPLIDLRRRQVNDDQLFQVFEGNDTGVRPNQTADDWAEYRGVSLTAKVDPTAGVPYYVLLVGHPDRVSFEFQNLLKMQWAVGRLAFDDVEDYGRYARAVVQYEDPAWVPMQRKNAAVWVTRNDDDVATAMLSNAICPNFLDDRKPLGSGAAKFTLDAFTYSTAKQATKQQLIDIVCGDLPGGPPAVFFTGSHGVEYPIADPLQRRKQGSLLTQEWVRGTSAGPDNLFSAEDIPAAAKLQGTMAVLFACYSGGCPADNNYYFNPDGSKIPIAPAPLIAALPQALLSRGALAVIAHIDMAFPYAFQDVTGTPQLQALRDPLTYLMLGRRAGYAADSLSDRWSRLCSQLIESQARTASTDPNAAPPLSPAARTALTIARDDARNYIVLGDPAARLRVKDLK
jgi:Peptidase family C25